jgi:hypothetical protein
MKLLSIALRTCPKFLNWLFLTSLVILFIKVLMLDDVPELFPRAHQLGELINGVLIANIAGYIFYILATEIPKVMDIRNRAHEALYWAESAAYKVTGFLQMVYNNNNETQVHRAPILDRELVDLNFVKEEFAKVSPTALAPMANGYKKGTIGPQLNWLGAMVTQERWSKRQRNKIWKRYPFFDSQLSSYLIAIESSRHVVGMKDVKKLILKQIKKGGQLENTDLTAWASNYYECYDIARDLLAYTKSFKDKYQLF